MSKIRSPWRRRRAPVEPKEDPAATVRLRQKLDERWAALRAEMAQARAEIERIAESGGDQFPAVRAYRERFGGLPRPRLPKRRRPDDGGIEPAPVLPKPKPTPLADGAEAPLD